MILEPVVPVNEVKEFFHFSWEAVLTEDKLGFDLIYDPQFKDLLKQKAGWTYLQTLTKPGDVEKVGKVGKSDDDFGVWMRWNYLRQANQITPGDHDGAMNSIIWYYLILGYQVKGWATKNPVPVYTHITPTPEGDIEFSGTFSSSIEKFWKKWFIKKAKDILQLKKSEKYNLPWNDTNVKYLLKELNLKSAKHYKRVLDKNNNIQWIERKKSRS